MNFDTATTADKIAMALGGGLILLGTVIMGILETVIGNPSAVPVTNDAGEVVATTTFPVDVRAYLILAGLLVWGLFVLYKVTLAQILDTGTERTTGSTEAAQ